MKAPLIPSPDDGIVVEVSGRLKGGRYIRLGAADLLEDDGIGPYWNSTMAQGFTHKLEYSHLAHTPDDCRRYELLDGALFVTPSPRPLHQRVSKRLQRQLEAYFEDNALGEVFNAPVDVILAAHDVVVPDLVVVTAPPQVTERAIEGAPALVVEILSPATRTRDRTLKAERYAALGVAHYWIVDPRHKTIECYRLRGTHYAPVTAAKGPADLTHPDWPDMTIDLAAIWREGPVAAS